MFNIIIKDLNKNHKKIIVIIIFIILIVIYYFIFNKDELLNKQEQVLNISEEDNEIINNESNNTKEKSEEEIVIHISGAVNKAGIVKLKVNSRVADAIEEAGGLQENADIEEINLAYIVEDGMKINIPSKEEITKDDQSNIKETKNNNAVQEESINFKNNKSSKININTATKTELETLPGIGQSTALKIIEYRKEKGKFKDIEEIKQVNGIGENKFNKLKDLISI